MRRLKHRTRRGRITRYSFLASSVGMAALMASAAQAQQAQGVPPASGQSADDAEIIVTATRRNENIQSVPASITAFTSGQLESRMVATPDDIANLVTNLSANESLGSGLPIYTLRGIAMADYSLNQNPPVAIYGDEVYKGSFVVQGLSMFDLDRVEVLKGPQGTLYGRNVTGGAVNLISRQPDFNFEGYLSAGYGNYDAFRSEGAIQGGIGSALAARLSYTFERSSGFVENVYPGAADANSVRQYGIRGIFLIQPDDRWKITVSLSTSLQNPRNWGVVGIPTASGIGAGLYEAFGVGESDFRTGLGPRTINTPDSFRTRHRTNAVSLRTDIVLSDGLNITSISSFDYGKIYVPQDGDGTPLKVVETHLSGTGRQYAQDIRLYNDSGSAFSFILGGYLFYERINNTNEYRYFNDLDQTGDGQVTADDCISGGFFLSCRFRNRFHQEKTSLAGYFDATWRISSALALRGGLRLTHDKGDLERFSAQVLGPDGNPLGNTVPGDSFDIDATTDRHFSITRLSGKIGVDLTLDSGTLLYASYSKGYRGSAFNAQAYFSPGELTVVKPETVDAVEAGFKASLFDRMVRLNGAAFWYGYKNQQFIDFDPNSSISPLANLPKSRILGAELEVNARPTSAISITAGIGFIDTRVIRGTSYGVDIAGNKLTQAPRMTANLATDLTLWSGPRGSVRLSGDASYRSRQYFDQFNELAQDGYMLVNGRISLRTPDDSKELSFWVKNLTNKLHTTVQINAPSLGYLFTNVNDPRTYGVSFKLTF